MNKWIAVFCNTLNISLKSFHYLAKPSYNSQKPATSAFFFMIQSILSDYKDVVHVVPVHKLSAVDLHVLIKKTVKGLDIVGFRVICIVTDNNAINGKAMSFF